MRTQGSVNGPVAPGVGAPVDAPSPQTPSGLPQWPGQTWPNAQNPMLLERPAHTQQSSVFVGPSGVAPTILLASG